MSKLNNQSRFQASILGLFDDSPGASAHLKLSTIQAGVRGDDYHAARNRAPAVSPQLARN